MTAEMSLKKAKVTNPFNSTENFAVPTIVEEDDDITRVEEPELEMS